MADAVELRMSYTAIKRVDPYVKDILAKSTHVALYKFNPALNEWEKTETEGALFLYSRNGEPFHSFMVMNRLNAENLIEPIIKEFEYQMQAPFLLYRNSKSKIFGIWFYNHDECISLTLLLESVMDTVKENSTDKSKKKEVDIFKLLTKAQEDYNKTPTKSESHPKFSSTPRAPDVTSQSVMDFFAKASTKSVSKPTHTPEGEIQYTLQRLMSNPAHTVEHIEKQQRAATPQEQPPVRKKLDAANQESKSVPNSIQSKENGMNFIRVASPQQQDISTSLNKFLSHQPKDEHNVTATSPLAKFLETPQKPALMPPIMFASCSKELSDTDKVNHVEPLTRSQMLQALSYLLRTDAEFVTKLHEAYVKSLSEIVYHNNSLL